MINRYNHHNIEPIFREYLLAEKVSKSTIKNYLSDIRGYFEWYEIQAANILNSSYKPDESEGLSYLRESNILLYVEYLRQTERKYGQINRFLSSMRKLAAFCVKTGLISENPLSNLSNLPKDSSAQIEGGNVVQDPVVSQFEAYLDTQLQRTSEERKDILHDIREYILYVQSIATNTVAIETIVNVQTNTHYKDELNYASYSPELRDRKARSLLVFYKWLCESSYINESVYSQLLSQWVEKTQKQEPTSRKNRINRKLLDKKKLTLFVYLFISLVGIMIILLYIWIYYSKSAGVDTSPALYTTKDEEGRVVYFQGRLLGEDGAPLVRRQDVSFRLYDSRKSSESIYEGSCVGVDGLLPDSAGIFDVEIGRDCSMDLIPENVFLANELYLGISVNGKSEMRPRHALPTTAYARNSDKVKGLSIGKGNDSIPYIDRDGRLVLGSESPMIQSTSGQFILEGNVLMLQTTPDSKGSIILNPSVGGNTIVGSGSVGIGTTNPTALLDIAGDASISGTLRFSAGEGLITSASNGAIRVGDSLTSDVVIKPQRSIRIGTVEARDKITLGGNVSPSTNNLYNLGRRDYMWKTVFANEFIGGTTGIQGYLRRDGSTLYTRFNNDSLVLGSESNQNVKFAGENNGTSWIKNGRLGIGTTNPDATLSVVKALENASVTLFSNLSSADTSDTNVLRLNLGTNPAGTTAQFVQFYAGATNETDGSKVGSIRLNNNGVVYETSGADFAEYFLVEEDAEYGDIVGFVNNSVVKTSPESSIIGVVTDEAGFVGNADQKENGTLVGLMGQVSTNVLTLNGTIQKGDPIGVSEIRGFGTKQITEGQIIGRALESFPEQGSSIDCPSGIARGDKILCGKIRVLVSVQWYNPEIRLTDAGDIQNDEMVQKSIASYSDGQNDRPYERLLGSLRQTAVQNAEVVQQLASEAVQITQVRANQVVTSSLQAVDAQLLSLQADEIKSPVIETERIETNEAVVNTIQPKESDVTIDLDPAEKNNNNQKGKIAELMIQGLEDSTVASIDARGNATFSGTVQTEEVQTQTVNARHITAEQMLTNLIQAREASIAGTLRANHVESENISEIERNLSSLSQSLSDNESSLLSMNEENDSMNSLISEIQQTIENINNIDSQAPELNITDVSGELLSYNKQDSSSENILEKLESSNVSFSELAVQGNADIYDASVSNSLTAGSIYIENDSILSLGYELNFESLGTISFFQSKVTISKSGDLRVGGEVTAEELSIESSSGEQVAAIDREGKGSFTSLSLRRAASPSAILVTPAENLEKNGVASHGLETNNETAGEGYVPADADTIIVYNENITVNSLIYLTSTSETSPAVLRVGKKESCTDIQGQCKPSFTVLAGNKDQQDVSFNWLIIN